MGFPLIYIYIYVLLYYCTMYIMDRPTLVAVEDQGGAWPLQQSDSVESVGVGHIAV